VSENGELRMILGFLSTIFVIHIGILWIGCGRSVITKSDIVYHRVEGVELSLDLYLPRRQPTTPRPSVLVVHGGGWRQGNKVNMERVAMMLAKRGYVAVSVSHRFAPDWSFPAQLEDVQAAVRWVRRHADEYNIDATKIGGLGISSGAHLVSLLGVVDSANSKDQISSKIQCVVDLAGPADLRLPICLDQLGDSPAAK